MTRRIPSPGELAARRHGREEALAAVDRVARNLRGAGMFNEYGIVRDAISKAWLLLDEEEESPDAR